MTTQAETSGKVEVQSPETIRYQRRRRLPGVELRTIFDSSRSYLFYSTGFEFLVPITWSGEVWHQRRKAVLEPGWILAAHPGDVYASKHVLQAGSWDSLTIDARSVLEQVGERTTWDRVRLRPFSRLSPRLESHFYAVVRSLKTDGIDCVLAHLRCFLAVVADELLEVEAETPVVAAPELLSRAAERFACFRSEIPASVPVAELATETGLSRFQATRTFKRRFGLPPQTYQLRVRLGVAQKALREGMPPALVAAELGFVNQSHFTRHFKRLVGVTPAAYVRDVIPTPTRPKTAQFDLRRR